MATTTHIEKTIRELREGLLSTQRIRMTPNVLQFWYLAERASWEDADSPQEGHVYNILGRRNNILEIRSLDEAMLLIKSAYWQGDTSGETQENVRTKQAIGKMGDRLIEMYGVDYRYPSFRLTKTGEVITLEEARTWVKKTLNERGEGVLWEVDMPRQRKKSCRIHKVARKSERVVA